jgi:hypothetical protein
MITFLILDALLEVRRAEMPVLLRCACEKISISSANAESNTDRAALSFTVGLGGIGGAMCIKQMARN